MDKSFLSRMIVSLLFLVPIAAFVAPSMENLESEHRRTAAFPEIPSKLRAGTIRNFFQGLDDFFLDRFPLRAFVLQFSMTLYEYSNDNVNMDKCYRGKENWLFLGNSGNRCVEKLQGDIILSDSDVERQVEAYRKLHDAAQHCGAEFFLFVGPNKSSVYPEYLPPIVVPARRRFLSPLLDALHREGISVYDPTQLLLEEKSLSPDILYWRTDTHWNALGAYKAFEGFRTYAKLPTLPPLFFTPGAVWRGDLVRIGGYGDFPLSVGDNFTLHWSSPLSLREENGLITNEASACDKSAWVFGDSFAEALRPYMTAMFKELRFFRHHEFEAMMTSPEEKPDIILWVQVERDVAKVF